MEKYREIERSIIKTYRKEIWSKFIKAIKNYQLIQEKYENMRNEIEKSFLVERRTSAFKICLYGIFTVLLSPVIIALHKHAGQTK